jgi:hypothetical protein
MRGNARWIPMLVLLALAGCQLEAGVNPTITQADLRPAVEQFSDLPVPRDMQLHSAMNQSRALQRGGFRTGYLVYEGPVGIDEVNGFLAERLPAHGWTLVEEDRPTQERSLRRWLQRKDGVLHYLLVTEAVGHGASCRLTYDLRTRRSSAADLPAPTSAKKAPARS